MGFAVVSIAAGLSSAAGWALAPVQALVSFFAPWQSGAVRTDHTPSRAHPRVPAFASTQMVPGAGCGPASPQPAHATPAAACPRGTSRLRVLRVAEPSRPRHCAGRMMISGRMADVCAELERLAQQEERAARG